MEEKTASETFRKLLASLQPYPNMRFLLFAEKWGVPEKVLARYCSEGGHELLLYRLGDSFGEEGIPSLSFLKHRPYRTAQQRYNLQGRLYDHLFVTGELPDPEPFAAKVYSAIANAGRLYILSDNTRSRQNLLWEQWLEKANYVSCNLIDLDGKRLFISAKKMHGWGG